MKTKVLICMSGGVDSSVAAALLVRAGYDVTGAFMKQWSDTEDIDGVCSWKQDRRDALRVAAHLDIPLITLDFEKEYKEWVMGYMFHEYEVGRTPNPDVMCNRFIKFGAWLEKAKEMGFDFLATGHYARVSSQLVSWSAGQPIQPQRRGGALSFDDTKISLVRAVDENKDQTYFLHQLNQDQLKHTLFPIGEYEKDQVREMAREFELPTAEREESMGICFVGEIPIKDFLQQKIKKHPGNILTTDGNSIGEHEGLAFYTIGQRHGFAQTGGGAPMYVVDKKFATNELIVGPEDDPALFKKEVSVEQMHWISGAAPEFPLRCSVRMRHRQALQAATATENNGMLHLAFDEAQKAVTPGQFAVLYGDSICLGGGIIAS